MTQRGEVHQEARGHCVVQNDALVQNDVNLLSYYLSAESPLYYHGWEALSSADGLLVYPLQRSPLTVFVLSWTLLQKCLTVLLSRWTQWGHDLHWKEVTV